MDNSNHKNQTKDNQLEFHGAIKKTKSSYYQSFC